jgi:hypothetical protein
VALQISLVSNKASRINVQNVAMAINSNCTRCTTVARALQYVFIVDDPKEVRPDISALIKAMDREFRAIHSDRSITLGEAEARINSVIRQYSSLANNLYARRSVDRD